MATTLRNNKKLMRKAMASILRSIPEPEVQAQSLAVVRHLLTSPSFRQCETVSCYLSMSSGEVDTSSLVTEILRAGKTLFVPKIDTTVDGRMDFLKVYCEEDLYSFPSGTWGIKEPSYEWQGSRRLAALEPSAGQLDLILLPGVAFDRSLSRLGHGKGYYDNFLSNYTSVHHGHTPKLVALALREQILEDGKVPIGDHDWKMDMIIGPDSVIEGSKAVVS